MHSAQCLGKSYSASLCSRKKEFLLWQSTSIPSFNMSWFNKLHLWRLFNNGGYSYRRCLIWSKAGSSSLLCPFKPLPSSGCSLSWPSCSSCKTARLRRRLLPWRPSRCKSCNNWETSMKRDLLNDTFASADAVLEAWVDVMIAFLVISSNSLSSSEILILGMEYILHIP